MTGIFIYEIFGFHFKFFDDIRKKIVEIHPKSLIFPLIITSIMLNYFI